MNCGRPAAGHWTFYRGLGPRTFISSEYSQKTYVPGTVLSLAESVPFKRLWLAEGVQSTTDMCETVFYLWWKQRALKGPEDNGNNSLFIKHLLCARHSSKHFHGIVQFILPPPSEGEQLPSCFVEEFESRAGWWS